MINLPDNTLIQCPRCRWEPDESCRWQCSVCKTNWNTFDTHGVCPTCGKAYEETMCLHRKGGCGLMSPHEDWYVKKRSGIFLNLFRAKPDELPVTEKNQTWITSVLLYQRKLIGRDNFNSLVTITPAAQFFNRNFDGSEADATYVLKRVAEILGIDTGGINLMYYSESPTNIADGITALPSDNLDYYWSGSLGRYVDGDSGQKEIWLDLELLQNTEHLIGVMAYMLVRHKLASEYDINDWHEQAISLAAVTYGFGIFIGNSYFRFTHWKSVSYSGWRMRKIGYLSEQTVAYAMAWLANYRNEDISWKKYLNKTMLKYFDKCYKHLSNEKSF